MNVVKPGIGRELAFHLRQDRMRKLLEKVELQFSLDYLDEAKATMSFMLEQAKGAIDADVGYSLANLFYKTGNSKSALQVLDMICQPDAKKTPRILNLKGMCCVRLNKEKEASQLFEMCILLDPGFVNSLNNLGNMAMHNKDYDKCKLYYTKSKESRLDSLRKQSVGQ